MFKKITLILILAVNVCFAQNNVNLQEDFESNVFPPAGWQINNGPTGLGDEEEWHASPVSNSGLNSASITYESLININDSAEDYLISKPFFLHGTSNELVFSHMDEDAFNFGSSFFLLLLDNQSTIHLLKKWTEDDLSSGFFSKETVDLSNWDGEEVTLAWMMRNNDGDSWFIDDIVVQSFASCANPRVPFVTSVSASTADVQWTPGGSETDWIIEYGDLNFAVGTGTGAQVTSSTPNATIVNLTPSSNYKYYVKSACSASDSSGWAGPYYLRSGCLEPLYTALPYKEDFDVTLDFCGWLTQDVNNDANVWVISNDNPSSNPNSLYINYNETVDMNDWMFSPGIVLDSGINYELEFKYRARDVAFVEKLEVFLGTEQADTAMSIFMFEDTAFNSATYITAKKQFKLNSADTLHIGFHGFSDADQWGIYIDDIVLRRPNNNPPVTAGLNNSADCIGDTISIPFTVTDVETDNANLITQFVGSSNNAVIPFSSVSILGTGTNRTVQVVTNGNSGSSTLSILVDDSDGFSDTAKLVVDVLSNVVPLVSAAPTATQICATEFVSFNSSVQDAGATPSYQWYVNGISAGIDSLGFVPDSVLLDGDTVTLVVTSSLSCAAPGTPGIDTILLDKIDPIEFTLNKNVCNGDSILFNGISYTDSGSYQAIFTSAQGCDSTVTLELAVSSAIIPSATAASMNATSCDGELITFSATGTGIGNAPTYQWQVNGVNINGETNPTYSSTTLVDQNSVSVVITSSESCAFPASAASTGVNVTILAASTAIVFDSICQGGSVVFNGQTYSTAGLYTATSTGANGCDSITTLDLALRQAPNVNNITYATGILTAPAGFNTYQWYLDGVAISGATGQSFTPTQNGDYTVEITDDNGCSNTSADYAFDNTGVEDYDLLNSIQLYPNPANEAITIDLGQMSNISISIRAADGRLIENMNITSGKRLLDLSTYAPGIYLIDLISNKISLTKRVIVQ